MVEDPRELCRAHLEPIWRELRQARSALVPEPAFALFLERTTLLDQYECDLVCRSLHLWPERMRMWRQADYLQEGRSALVEIEKQRLSEMLALRLQFGLRACDPRWSGTLLEGVVLTGCLELDLKRLLMDAWYRNWNAWLFECYRQYWMPLRNQFE